MTTEVSNLSSGDDYFIASDIAPDTGAHTLACGNTSNEDGLAWLSIYNAGQTADEDTNTFSGCANQTSCSLSIGASATSMTFGGFKLDRGAGTPSPMSGITKLADYEATIDSGYGIGVTTFGFTSITSGGGKAFAVIAWPESSGGGGEEPAVEDEDYGFIMLSRLKETLFFQHNKDRKPLLLQDYSLGSRLFRLLLDFRLIHNIHNNFS